MKTSTSLQDLPAKSEQSAITQKFFQNLQFTFPKLDRFFAILIVFEWLAAIAISVFSRINADRWEQSLSIAPWQLILFVGGAIVSATFLLAILRPGKFETRHTIAVGQILIASLLSYLIGENTEAHIHIFISLALLSVYRDWRILISAMICVMLEHFAYYLPFSSSFGELLANSLNHWTANSWWLLFVNMILIFWLVRSDENRRRKDDLTARLNASEERFLRFVNTVEDLIYRTDKDGYFTYFNPAFTSLLGYSVEDKKLHYLDIVAPSHRKKVEKFYVRQTLRHIFSTYNEFPALTTGGREIWVGQKVQIIYENDEIAGFQAVARDINEVKRVQNALAESEENYRFLANFLPQHVWRMTPEGDFTYLNEQAFKYFGLDLKENLPPKNWKEVIHPDDLEKTEKSWKEALKARKRYECEYRVRRLKGEYRWFLGLAVPVVDENNRVVEFFGTSTDIHDRKLAQEEAAKNREYVNLFKHANDAIVIYDPENGEILDVNDFACNTFGYTREEFLNGNLNTICLDPINRAERTARVLLEKSIENYRSIIAGKDGTPIHISVNSSLIEFRGKQAILSINRDITAVVEADKALRKNENKLRSLVENMHEGLVEVDRDETILFVNQRFCEIVGYSYEELIGQNIAPLITDDESRARVAKAHEERYQGKAGTYEIKLYHKTGKPLWFLLGGVPVTDEDGNIIGSMGVHTDITDIKHNEELLRFNALHDALTGLPNRLLLNEHLQNSIDRIARHPEDIFAVLFLDLNLFKIVNDSLGHLEGDKLLVMIARRLEECLRSGDIIARFGGDEFTILLSKIEGMDDVLQVVNRIRKTLDSPFTISGRKIFIGTSIGIVLSNSDYKKPEEILRDADIAMYRAKASGTSRYEIFDQQMHEQANLRLQLETEMRSAIERNEIKVFYQPIVELNTNRITGFEALIRWIHPTRGMISPLNFIPLAEENHLILPIGEWILRESCRQTREWQMQNPLNSELTISVNLSVKQLDQENLVEMVANILEETNLQPEFLRLEITESHLMGKMNQAIEIMNRLRDLGVKISIDDFGTGYSNLSYLHQMPVNYLKIDRSFVNGINENQENLEIVRTILTLAQNLDFSVIAEGIETEIQADQLRLLNCEFGQGYLYSKPVEAAKAADLLNDSKSPKLPFAEIKLVSETIS